MIRERLHTIYIDWSYPVRITNKENSSHYYDECGLYYITRRYLRCPIGERNLYIGETKRSFHKRLKEHEDERKPSKWTFAYGEKYIRFGTIRNLPVFDDEKELKKFLRTIETAIIWEIDPEGCDLVNKSQTKSAELAYKLRIINDGYRGNLPREIYSWD